MLIKKLSLPPKTLLGADENWKKKKNMKIRKGLMPIFFLLLNVEIVFSIGFLKKTSLVLFFYPLRVLFSLALILNRTKLNLAPPRPVEENNKVCKNIFVPNFATSVFSKECKKHFNH